MAFMHEFVHSGMCEYQSCVGLAILARNTLWSILCPENLVQNYEYKVITALKQRYTKLCRWMKITQRA